VPAARVTSRGGPVFGFPMDTKSASVTVAVPTQAGAYASGQVVGGLLALPKAGQHPGTGCIVTVTVSDEAKQDLALDVFFFNGKPAGAFADAAAFNPSAADNRLVAGWVTIAATDYKDGSATSVACPASKPIVFQGAPASDPNKDPTTTLYAVIVARGAPTYGANKMALTVGILQD